MSEKPVLKEQVFIATFTVAILLTQWDTRI